MIIYLFPSAVAIASEKKFYFFAGRSKEFDDARIVGINENKKWLTIKSFWFWPLGVFWRSKKLNGEKNSRSLDYINQEIGRR